MTISSTGFVPSITDATLFKGDMLRPAATGGTGFADRLGEAFHNLADSQTKATQSAQAYELGERQDLAGVMVDQQVSSLGFQLALNVRNRALTAYRDIMNMSV